VIDTTNNYYEANGLIKRLLELLIMRSLLFLFLSTMMSISVADNTFCRDQHDESGTYLDFSVKFCFSSPEFMKSFASKLYDANISFIVYENGYIGYKQSDKPKVQKIGDELVMDFFGNKK